MKDALRAKYTSSVAGKYQGMSPYNNLLMMIMLMCIRIKDSRYLKMKYYIRPSTLTQNIIVEDPVCKKTFMSTWGITKNAMEVLKNLSHSALFSHCICLTPL